MYKTIFAMLLIVATMPAVFAGLTLNDISYDPAIIAAGDEVDIVIQFEDTTVRDNPLRVNDPRYTFKVWIEGDDSLTDAYVTIQDAQGDTVGGSILQGGLYSKKFRVKVATNAPPGTYEFKVNGQWYKDGVAEDAIQTIRFTMDVKKEGIILDVSTLQTSPAEIRPGDSYVEIKTYLTNVGEKDAKSIDISLQSPEGIDASYTSNNRVWLGSLQSMQSQETSFFVDVDEDVQPGVYNITYFLTYLDYEDNSYTTMKTVPFLVKDRPYLEVVASEGSARAGTTGQLIVTIKNTGTESAEAVDVRLIKQNTQPFTMDVRSDYIGELAPGETGIAIFDVKALRSADMKNHSFKLLVRAKGDSDEGDDRIYTFNRRAEFTITGAPPNYLLWVGIVLLVVIVAGFFVWRRR